MFTVNQKDNPVVNNVNDVNDAQRQKTSLPGRFTSTGSRVTNESLRTKKYKFEMTEKQCIQCLLNVKEETKLLSIFTNSNKCNKGTKDCLTEEEEEEESEESQLEIGRVNLAEFIVYECLRLRTKSLNRKTKILELVTPHEILKKEKIKKKKIFQQKMIVKKKKAKEKAIAVSKQQVLDEKMKIETRRMENAKRLSNERTEKRERIEKKRKEMLLSIHNILFEMNNVHIHNKNNNDNNNLYNITIKRKLKQEKNDNNDEGNEGNVDSLSNDTEAKIVFTVMDILTGKISLLILDESYCCHIVEISTFNKLKKK